MSHEIQATVTRSHGETLERVELTCTCGVKTHYRRRHNAQSPVRDAAGFPAPTGNQGREMVAQGRMAHAKAGVLL